LDLIEIRALCLKQAMKLITEPIIVTTTEQSYSNGPQIESGWIYMPDNYGNLIPFKVGSSYAPPTINMLGITIVASKLEEYLLRAEQDALDHLGQAARAS
jgi:hypothetical protein